MLTQDILDAEVKAICNDLRHPNNIQQWPKIPQPIMDDGSSLVLKVYYDWLAQKSDVQKIIESVFSVFQLGFGMGVRYGRALELAERSQPQDE